MNKIIYLLLVFFNFVCAFVGNKVCNGYWYGANSVYCYIVNDQISDVEICVKKKRDSITDEDYSETNIYNYIKFDKVESKKVLDYLMNFDRSIDRKYFCKISRFLHENFIFDFDSLKSVLEWCFNQDDYDIPSLCEMFICNGVRELLSNWVITYYEEIYNEKTKVELIKTWKTLQDVVLYNFFSYMMLYNVICPTNLSIKGNIIDVVLNNVCFASDSTRGDTFCQNLVNFLKCVYGRYDIKYNFKFSNKVSNADFAQIYNGYRDYGVSIACHFISFLKELREKSIDVSLLAKHGDVILLGILEKYGHFYDVSHKKFLLHNFNLGTFAYSIYCNKRQQISNVTKNISEENVFLIKDDVKSDNNSQICLDVNCLLISIRRHLLNLLNSDCNINRACCWLALAGEIGELYNGFCLDFKTKIYDDIKEIRDDVESLVKDQKKRDDISCNSIADIFAIMVMDTYDDSIIGKKLCDFLSANLAKNIQCELTEKLDEYLSKKVQIKINCASGNVVMYVLCPTEVGKNFFSRKVWTDYKSNRQILLTMNLQFENHFYYLLKHEKSYSNDDLEYIYHTIDEYRENRNIRIRENCEYLKGALFLSDFITIFVLFPDETISLLSSYCKHAVKIFHPKSNNFISNALNVFAPKKFLVQDVVFNDSHFQHKLDEFVKMWDKYIIHLEQDDSITYTVTSIVYNGDKDDFYLKHLRFILSKNQRNIKHSI